MSRWRIGWKASAGAAKLPECSSRSRPRACRGRAQLSELNAKVSAPRHTYGSNRNRSANRDRATDGHAISLGAVRKRIFDLLNEEWKLSFRRKCWSIDQDGDRCGASGAYLDSIYRIRNLHAQELRRQVTQSRSTRSAGYLSIRVGPVSIERGFGIPVGILRWSITPAELNRLE